MGINGSNLSFWREKDSEYVGYVPVPGVFNPSVTQKGRVLTITGKNDTLDISYEYSVTLHPESTENPSVREENGLVVIRCPKISTIKRHLHGAITPADPNPVRIIPG